MGSGSAGVAASAGGAVLREGRVGKCVAERQKVVFCRERCRPWACNFFFGPLEFCFFGVELPNGTVLSGGRCVVADGGQDDVHERLRESSRIGGFGRWSLAL